MPRVTSSATGDGKLSAMAAFCPGFQSVIELIGRRWTGAIIYVARNGISRYSEFTSAIPGLSARLLSQRLRVLENEGLMMRVVIDAPPPQVHYYLTPAGTALAGSLSSLVKWGERWRGHAAHRRKDR